MFRKCTGNSVLIEWTLSTFHLQQLCEYICIANVSRYLPGLRTPGPALIFGFNLVVDVALVSLCVAGILPRRPDVAE